MDETSEPRNDLQAKPLLLDELRGLILGARERVARTVNKELVMLYWSVGRRIREDVLGAERAKYGEEIVSTLSRQLSGEFGNGFSRPNLFSMLRFAELWPNETAVAPLADRLSWSHFRELISIEQPLRREFYSEMCRREGWSVRTLRGRVQGMMYERTLVSQQPERVIRQELALLREEGRMTPDLVFRDPYLLDFLGLADTYSERDFESAILKELERFLLELGGDFSFISRQKRMSIGGQDYYLDLLFYHRSLTRLVAIDLKLGRFEAAFKGQMELYLRWLDKHERKDAENSPLGLILCSEKNHEQIELLELNSGEIRVAEYLIQLPDRRLLEAKLADAVRRAEQSVLQHIDSRGPS
jgi:predicted nuclease of restriction endonuclease-like (RecB) superfamily